MRPASQVLRSRVAGAPRAYAFSFSGRPSSRKLWTSAARAKTKGEAQKFARSLLVQKYKNVLVPDFGKLNMLDSRQLFEVLREFIPSRNMQLIVASSNNEEGVDYDQIGRLIEEATGEGMPGTLVVKGSGKHALVDSDLVRQQYAETIQMVKRAGGRLLLPIRVDLDPDAVLRDIDRKLLSGADGFVSHPIFNAALIDLRVRKVLKAIAAEHPDFSIQYGAMWLDQELYQRVESKKGQLVTREGLDQYPMRQKPMDGEWENWNVGNMKDIQELIMATVPKQRISDSYYSRVGLGHPEESVMKIASIIETILTPVEGLSEPSIKRE